MTLNNLGTGFSDLGERGEARRAFNEALDIYLPLAEQLPQAFGPNFMTVLRNDVQLIGEAPDDPWYQLWQQMHDSTTP